MWIKLEDRNIVRFDEVTTIQFEDQQNKVASPGGTLLTTGDTKRIINVTSEKGETLTIAQFVDAENSMSLEEDTDKVFAAFEAALAAGGHYWDVSTFGAPTKKRQIQVL